MSIPDTTAWDKASRGPSHIFKDWVLVAILALTAFLFLGIGLLIAKENPKPGDSLWIEQLPPEELPGSMASTSPAALASTTDNIEKRGVGQFPVPSKAQSALPPQPAAAAAALLPQTGTYVASKTGTKFYLPSCATAKRIKTENKRWFATKQQAEAAGYQPAANCKGL